MILLLYSKGVMDLVKILEALLFCVNFLRRLECSMLSDYYIESSQRAFK